MKIYQLKIPRNLKVPCVNIQIKELEFFEYKDEPKYQKLSLVKLHCDKNMFTVLKERIKNDIRRYVNTYNIIIICYRKISKNIIEFETVLSPTKAGKLICCEKDFKI